MYEKIDNDHIQDTETLFIYKRIINDDGDQCCGNCAFRDAVHCFQLPFDTLQEQCGQEEGDSFSHWIVDMEGTRDLQNNR